MLSVCRARETAKKKLAACVHVDDTSRVQLVNEKTNRLFNELIEIFFSMSGIPALLNTSFNLRGEPIVNNTEDAINTFRKSGLDILYVNNYRIEKN